MPALIIQNAVRKLIFHEEIQEKVIQLYVITAVVEVVGFCGDYTSRWRDILVLGLLLLVN